MIRKLVIIILLGGVICLSGTTIALAQKQFSTVGEYEKITGGKIEKFNEAPMLKVKVATGELPPVKERLPKDPQVLEPVEEIGEYGGTAYLFSVQPKHPGDGAYVAGYEPLLRTAPDCKTPTSNIAKKWNFSKDYKTLILYLHEGIKWSDGVPFTADDIMFWYKDIFLNDELTPAKDKNFCPGDEPLRIEKVDDYTIRLHFADSYPVVTLYLAFTGGLEMVRYPCHYLKRFHIKYNPKANELAKENGFDFWYQYFKERTSAWAGVPTNPELPIVGAFKCVKIASDHILYERNPYYWKVDTKGNQLPYIDKLLVRVVEPEIYQGKIVSGEADFAARATSLDNYPMYMRGEKEGDYRVLLWPSTLASVAGYQANQTHKDPILRKIFRDVSFRRALSLAINREEINESLFFGLAVPCQATVLPQCSYYEEKFAKSYAEYNPEEANTLLDEMGLEWDKKHEYRLRPDGKRLAWTVEYIASVAGMTVNTPISELVKSYWKRIGCQITLKEETGELLGVRAPSNDMDMIIFIVDTTEDIYFTFFPRYFVPISAGWETTWGVEWAHWYLSRGEKGEEPPEEVKNLLNWWEKMRTVPSDKERIQLGKKILASQAENLWVIGTVGRTPAPYIVKNNFRNVPEKSLSGYSFWYTMPCHPEQFFLKQK